MESMALALLNLLLAFYGGGAVVTALRLYRESDAGGGGAAAALFPRELSASCGALGGCGLALLLLPALALWGILDSSLRRCRFILIFYGGAMLALCVAEAALGAWLVWRVQPASLDTDLHPLLKEVSLSEHESVEGLAAAWAAVLALLQAAALAAAAAAACRAHQELRLRRRFSLTSL